MISTMLKRKRSNEELSLPATRVYPHVHLPLPETCAASSPIHNTSHSPWPTSIRASTPTHLHSRTLKRHRNNRPSEDEVHRHTLELLFKAQNSTSTIHSQKQHDTSTVSSPFPRPLEVAVPPPKSHSGSHQQQPSLHRFFNIGPLRRPTLAVKPARRSVAPETMLDHVTLDPPRCEDCGVLAMPEDHAGDSHDGEAMEIDGGPVRMHDSGQEAQLGAGECVSCGKVVCERCCVSVLGDNITCLVCARTGRNPTSGGSTMVDTGLGTRAIMDQWISQG